MGAPELPRAFYWRLAAACFVIGGCMELFMIKTGFYRIVTEAESEAWEASREERDAARAELRGRLLEQYRRRGQAPPAVLLDGPPPSPSSGQLGS